MANEKLKSLLDVLPVIAVGSDGKMTRVTADNIDEIRKKYSNKSSKHTAQEIYDVVNQSLRNDDDYADIFENQVFIIKTGTEKYWKNGNLKSAEVNEVKEIDIDWKDKTLADCGPDSKISITEDGRVDTITLIGSIDKLKKNKKSKKIKK